MIKTGEVEPILNDLSVWDEIPKNKRELFMTGLNQYFEELCKLGTFLSDVPYRQLSRRARTMVAMSYYRIYTINFPPLPE